MDTRMDFETKNAVERLRLGGADQRDRDRVLCYLADSRWTGEQLEAKIEETHNDLCRECPIKIEYNSGSSFKGKTEKALFWALMAVIGILSALVTGGHIAKP